MRCIETELVEIMSAMQYDKLQHEMYWNAQAYVDVPCGCWINYNMRCIETKKERGQKYEYRKINYNMRCIETMQQMMPQQINFG